MRFFEPQLERWVSELWMALLKTLAHLKTYLVKIGNGKVVSLWSRYQFWSEFSCMEVALRKVSAAAMDALSFDGFLSISESIGFNKIHFEKIIFKFTKDCTAAVDAFSFDCFLSISESDGFGKIHLKEIYFKIHKRLYYCCGAWSEFWLFSADLGISWI